MVTAVQSSSNPIYIKLPDGNKRMPHNNIAQVYDMGGFAIATYEIGKFRFSPGMRYDHNSLYGQSLNPRATAIYKYSRTGQSSCYTEKHFKNQLSYYCLGLVWAKGK